MLSINLLLRSSRTLVRLRYSNISYSKTLPKLQKLDVRSFKNFKLQSRNQSSASNSLPPMPILSETPPFIVRIALVGTTVGLATPIFALMGAFRVWYGYIPRSYIGQAIKYLISILAGGGFVKLLYSHIIPFLQNNSDVILPFAISNAVTAMFWYSVGEMLFGLSLMAGSASTEKLRAFTSGFMSNLMHSAVKSGVPVAGPIIGFLTALTVPLLWNTAFAVCWNQDLRSILIDHDPSWPLDVYSWIFVPVALPVGVFAGLTLHFGLKPIIIGSPGVPWQSRSLPVLGVVTSAALLYFGLCKSHFASFTWEKRTNPKSGQVYSYNPNSMLTIYDNGKLADATKTKQRLAVILHAIRNPISALLSSQDDKTSRQLSGRKLAPRRITTSSVHNVSVNEIPQRSLLYLAIDSLLQLKYCQVLLTTNKGDDSAVHDMIQSRYANINNMLDRNFNQSSKDLNEFLNIVEKLVVVNKKREEVIVASKKLPNEQINFKSLKSLQLQLSELDEITNELKKKLKSNFISKSAKSSAVSKSEEELEYWLDLLLVNLPAVEAEYMKSLGIQIATYEKVVNTVETEIDNLNRTKFNKRVNVGLVLGLVGLTAASLGIYLRR